MRHPSDLYDWVRWLVIAVATGFWLAVFALAMGCGGASTSQSAANGALTGQPAIPAPAPMQVNYRDFIPRESVTRTLKSGNTYTVQMLPGDDFDVLWGGTWEEHRIVDYAGERWLMAVAFRNVDPPARYTLSTSRVEIDRHDGRGWQSLPPSSMAPYVPLSLSGPISIREWGTVGGMAFFWASTFTPQPSVFNPCWQGAGDAIRPGIRQAEAWWDQGSGWLTSRGSGPLGADGLPTGAVTYTDWFQTLGGYGAGWLWQGAGGECLVR